ncbi:hypothetical protein DBV15_10335 [Temnothorax longispinosus]|uniref:Uncharacterized protein n=1 Tax=Temnothorax longispinosus TaxID=300112 RepID=A0A4S2L4M9_9HYME|nr:hypothetical protein DBV15_10335 [Temnothorax longispinosus]
MVFSRGIGAPTILGISRTTERTKLARRPGQRNERDGSSPGEERWPISRYSAHMPRPTIRRSCGGGGHELRTAVHSSYSSTKIIDNKY